MKEKLKFLFGSKDVMSTFVHLVSIILLLYIVAILSYFVYMANLLWGNIN